MFAGKFAGEPRPGRAPYGGFLLWADGWIGDQLGIFAGKN
jgi:hypothetical protein